MEGFGVKEYEADEKWKGMGFWGNLTEKAASRRWSSGFAKGHLGTLFPLII